MLPPAHKAVVAAFTGKPSLINQLEVKQTSGLSLKELQKEIRAKREAWEALTRRNADIEDEFVDSASAADLRKSLDFYESQEAYTVMAPMLLMLLKKLLSTQKKRGGGIEDANNESASIDLTVQIMKLAKELLPLSKDHFQQLSRDLKTAPPTEKQRILGQFAREKESLRIKLGTLRTMYESLVLLSATPARQHQAVFTIVSRYQAPPFCNFLDVDELLSLISRSIQVERGGGICVSKQQQVAMPMPMPTQAEIDEFIKANLEEAAKISGAFGKNKTLDELEAELVLFDLEDAAENVSVMGAGLRALAHKHKRTRPQKRKSA